MVAHHMPFVVHTQNEGLVLLNMFTDAEKCRFNLLLPQNIQDCARFCIGAIVEGECDKMLIVPFVVRRNIEVPLYLRNAKIQQGDIQYAEYRQPYEPYDTPEIQVSDYTQ